MASHLMEYELKPEVKTEINDVKFYISTAFNKYLQGTTFDIIANLKLNKIKDGFNLLSDLLLNDKILEDGENNKFIDEIKKQLEEFQKQEKERLKQLYIDTENFIVLDTGFFKLELHNEQHFAYEMIKTNKCVPYIFKLVINEKIRNHIVKKDNISSPLYHGYNNIASTAMEDIGSIYKNGTILFNIGETVINNVRDLSNYFTYELAKTIINKLKEICDEIRKIETHQTKKILENVY
jgi:hypothetical protein